MNDFEKWFRNLWEKNEGLISPADVARIWGLKGKAASVIPIWKKRKKEIYRFNGNKNIPYLSWKDFQQLDSERKFKKSLGKENDK